MKLKYRVPSYTLAGENPGLSVPVDTIEGIGRGYKASLEDIGITNLVDLQHMNIGYVNARKRLSLLRLKRWQCAALLLQVPGMDEQVAEALVKVGFTDVRSIAAAEPMEIYYAVQVARTPREERNLIPDRYDRVISPATAWYIKKDAYYMCYPGGRKSTQGVFSLAPFSRWIPADEANYGRNPDCRDIKYIVIHAMAGSMDGTIDHFANPNPGKASAHYLVDRDGEIVQMVEESDVAFHAANYDVDCRGHEEDGCSGKRSTGKPWYTGPCNCTSIGIELEDRGGFKDDSNWVTSDMYRETAKLVRNLCEKYNISKRFVGRSRGTSGILGHQHVASRTKGKSDPGKYFNWSYFMSLVNPARPKPPEEHDDSSGGKK
jgi:N-acetyl-anhydromuramyl-L-alanine amidase AmpD